MRVLQHKRLHALLLAQQYASAAGQCSQSFTVVLWNGPACRICSLANASVHKWAV